MKEGDRHTHTHTHTEKDLPSVGEGVSLNIHPQTKTHQSQHSTHSRWIESTAGRAHRKTNRALACLNTILTMQLWLSLLWFSRSFNAMCVTDDSWGEIRKPTTRSHTTEVLNSMSVDRQEMFQLLVFLRRMSLFQLGLP